MSSPPKRRTPLGAARNADACGARLAPRKAAPSRPASAGRQSSRNLQGSLQTSKINSTHTAVARKSTTPEANIAALLPEHAQPVTVDAPPKYKGNASGLFRFVGGEYVRLSSPMKWLGHLVDADGTNPAHLLQVTTMTSTRVSVEIADTLLSKPADFFNLLISKGVQIDPLRDAAKHIIQFLKSRPSQPLLLRVKAGGWQHVAGIEGYVLGEKFLAASPTELRIVPTPNSQLPRSTSGTLCAWNQFSALCVGNPLLTAAYCFAYASALLRPLEHESFAVALVGPSSSGKTTILRAVAALTGNPRILPTWEGTANGLQALAAMHADVPFVLDEIGQANRKAFSDMAYGLLNGSGKTRAMADGNLAAAKEISTVVLSAGELTPTEHIESAGQQVMLGQLARFIALPVDCEHGAFSDLHNAESAAAFAGDIAAHAHQTHGVAWPVYVRYVVSNLASIKGDFFRRLSSIKADITGDCHIDSSDGVVDRILGHFVLAAYAGFLAGQAHTLALNERQIIGALRACFSKWLIAYRASNTSQGEKIRQAIRDVIRSNLPKVQKLSTYSEDEIEIRLYESTHRETSEQVYLLKPDALRAVIGRFGATAMHTAMRDGKWLIEGPENRPKKQWLIPGRPKKSVNFYTLRKAMLM